MAEHTDIEWADATWNIITGCSMVSPGCTNCYAMRLAGSRLRNHSSRKGLTRESEHGPVWTGEIRFNEEWLLLPLQWKKPKRIFVCAHADLFHEGVKDKWRDKIFAVMALCPQHTFIVLTKRAEEMREYFCGPYPDGEGVAARIADATWNLAPTRKQLPDPPIVLEIPIGPRLENGEPEFGWRRIISARSWPLRNVWLGVTVENEQAVRDRLPYLKETAAAVRFISAEPLLEDIAEELNLFMGTCTVRIPRNVEPIRKFDPDTKLGSIVEALGGSITDNNDRVIDWIIAGGESGNGARPSHPDWFRNLRGLAEAYSVPFLFKQWGEWSDTHPDWPKASSKTMANDGTVYEPGDLAYPDGKRRGEALRHHHEHAHLTAIYRPGKKAAGRLLDGVEHIAFPEGRS